MNLGERRKCRQELLADGPVQGRLQMCQIRPDSCLGNLRSPKRRRKVGESGLRQITEPDRVHLPLQPIEDHLQFSAGLLGETGDYLRLIAAAELLPCEAGWHRSSASFQLRLQFASQPLCRLAISGEAADGDVGRLPAWPLGCRVPPLQAVSRPVANPCHVDLQVVVHASPLVDGGRPPVNLRS